MMVGFVKEIRENFQSRLGPGNNSGVLLSMNVNQFVNRLHGLTSLNCESVKNRRVCENVFDLTLAGVGVGWGGKKFFPFNLFNVLLRKQKYVLQLF